jgi:hypothetical protein
MRTPIASTIPTLLFSLALFPACVAEDDGDDELADADTDTDTGESGDEGGIKTGGTETGALPTDDGGDFGSDGGLSGCAANLVEDDCVAAAGCNPVYGEVLVEESEDSWCTGPEEFIGCVKAGDLCPPLSKVLCAGGQLWQTSECVPDNVMVCEAPGDVSGPC